MGLIGVKIGVGFESIWVLIYKLEIKYRVSLSGNEVQTDEWKISDKLRGVFIRREFDMS